MKRRNFLKSQHIRQYRAQRFQNPYFKNEVKKRGRWKKILIFVTILMVIVAIPALFIATPILKISAVNVQGLSTIPNSDIEQIVQYQFDTKRWGIFPQNHLLFFNKQMLHDRLQEEYNFITLKTKLHGKTLEIVAEERITSLVWISEAAWHFIDLEGMITRSLFEQESNIIKERLGMAATPIEEGQANMVMHPTMPIIKDLSLDEIETGQQVLSSAAVESILTFDQAVRRLILDPFQYEIEEPKAQWMTLKTKNGFDILFDLKHEIEKQKNTLGIILSEYNERLEEISYIDLRFGNHVFVK
ncbi:hypothetical protein IH979_00565 [Patescibacteria group bacterium]|nr:hypothetical protein [Patescibacteria group bacterium]